LRFLTQALFQDGQALFQFHLFALLGTQFEDRAGRFAPDGEGDAGVEQGSEGINGPRGEGAEPRACLLHQFSLKVRQLFLE
jgi:hypothetical protein